MPLQAAQSAAAWCATRMRSEVHARRRARRQELHFSLRRGFADPAAWGLLFVDAARHVARVYAHEKLFSEDEAVERIRAAFEQAIREPPEGSAEVTAIAKPE